MYRGVQGAAFMVGAGGAGAFQVIGTGIAAVGIGEALGKIANKTGRQMAEVSRIFAQPSSHARFLHRVSIDESVSPALRKSAARLYKMRGTKAYDVVFDALVAGIGSGAAQVALEAAKGKSAEEVGWQLVAVSQWVPQWVCSQVKEVVVNLPQLTMLLEICHRKLTINRELSGKKRRDDEPRYHQSICKVGHCIEVNLGHSG